MNINKLCKGLLVSSFVLSIGCNDPDLGKESGTGSAASSSNGSTIATQVALQSPNVNLELWNSELSTMIYNGINVGSMYVTNGTNYVIKIVSSDPDTTGYSIYMKLSNAITQTVVSTTTLSMGNNSFTAPAPGSYKIEITASAPNMNVSEPKIYTLESACSTANALTINSTALSVTGSQNWYTYSAAGVASGGMGPFKCRYDFNGDSIYDTNLVDCATPVSDFSDLVLSRTKMKIGVFDQGCNSFKEAIVSRTLSAPKNSTTQYALTLDAILNEQIYIAGKVAPVSGSSAALTADPRTTASFYSHNLTPLQPAPVTCNFAYDKVSGKGVFTTTSSHQYNIARFNDANGVPQKVTEGMSVSFKDIPATITVNGTSANVVFPNTGAVLSKIRYKTDYSADAGAVLDFKVDNAPSCTVQKIKLVALNPVGVPCTSGPVQNGVKFTIKAAMKYSCQNIPDAIDPTKKINITEGSSLCYYDYADDCVGGGGGGGGIIPIEL